MAAKETKEKIIAAASDVFARKGKHGARMEEIAQKAGVNKAMLYYFFSSKENLHRDVLSDILHRIFSQVSCGIEKTGSSDDHVAFLRRIINNHFEAFSKDTNATKIVLEAIARDPDDVRKAIEHIAVTHCGETANMHSEKARAFLYDGIKKGVFRDVDPRQLLISIIGMNLIYFMTKPIAKVILDIDVKNEQDFLRHRTESVTDLVLNGILKRKKCIP